MITCELMGGLGNQLFQIFATISYAIKNKQMFKFEYSDILTIGVPRPTYWNSFLYKLKPFTFSKTHDISRQQLSIVKEKGFHYTELPWSDALQNSNVMLVGYFQSHKYFSIFYNTICKMIGLENQKMNVITKYRNFFTSENQTEECEFEKYIGIHFRLGDYKDNPNIHPILNKEYYEKALLYVMSKTDKKDWKILYFCEEKSNKEVEETIEYLKKTSSNCQFIKVTDSIPDWEQVLLMSCCTHNIIANSTFSWWGAYLNSNPNKIVCYPNKWFGKSMPNHQTLFTNDDLFPSTWMMIE